MALINPIHGEMSGSIAGNTWSRNRGGQYVRQRTIPTDPNTPFQSARRSVFGQLAIAWSSLGEDQRAGWNQFAAQVPVTNKLGNVITLSGINWFVHVNTLQFLIGGVFISQPPTVPTLAQLTQPEVTVTVGAQIASVAFTDSDTWANQDGAFLIAQQGQNVSPGIVSYKSPFRIVGGIAGDGAAPPASPQDPGVLQFPVTAGAKNFWRFTAVLADGRPSPPTIVEATLA